MKSTKNRKKGLISIVSLIVCLAMLTVGTYAWFTDTATVGGNKVMAGNLGVDVVMTGKEIIDKMVPPGSSAGDFEADWATATASGSPFEDVERIKDGATPGVDAYDAYYKVSGLKVGVFELGNVEPGQVFPVSMTVMNTGDLAAGFTAGFSLPVRGGEDPDKNLPTSYTGLETLEMQMNEGLKTWENAEASGTGAYVKGSLSGTMDEDAYELRKANLLEKQWDQAKLSTYDSSKTALYSAADNKGGYLENVLEVYAVKEEDLKNTNYFDTLGKAKPKAAELTANIPATYDPETGEELTPEKKNERYIGTVIDIVNANKPGYTTDDPEEAARLEAVKEKLAKYSIGYTLPTDSLPTGGATPGTVNVTLTDGAGNNWTKNGVSDIGKVTYLIKMSEDADDTYQNAYIMLDAGVTANQVKWETDGTGYYLYDPNPIIQ